jgi:site-specific recombinase XerD
MTDLRGFAQKTVTGRCREARSFLGWWKQRSGQVKVTLLTVADVDQYMKERAATLRRTGLSSMANALRNFLRWLHNSGHTERDLSAVLIGPSLYAFEGIPSALKWTDVERVLDALCHDRTPKGMRDYAIWMLLSRYGLRSGEIRALRLDDIDWDKEVVRIRHTKTGTTSYLPLLPEVGEAILRYLEKSRPTVSYREMFIRHIAPRRPFKRIYQVVRRRLDAACVVTSGRRGPHALRHARAVKLLSGKMSLKQIGDVLGHQHSSSTMIYLKLATDELRKIALDIPTEAGA